jgi:hypothetical protein
MSSLLIALFIAAQHPTHKNCRILEHFLKQELSSEYGCDMSRPGCLIPRSLWGKEDEMTEFFKSTCPVEGKHK